MLGSAHYMISVAFGTMETPGYPINFIDKTGDVAEGLDRACRQQLAHPRIDYKFQSL